MQTMPLRGDRQTLRTIHWGALILLLIACSERSERGSVPTSNGTLIIASSADANGLFPPLITASTSRQIDEQIYDYLAVVGPDLNTFGDKGFLPRLAESWKWAPDSLSITFAIDSRARWHDGIAADANDVQYTYKVYTSPALGSGTASELTNIDSVTVADSHHATFWYHARSSHQLLDATQMMILPRHLLGQIPMDSLKTAAEAATPIGTGRFRFKRRTVGSSVELSADTANYRGRPGLDRIIWSVSPNAKTTAMKLFGGEADMYGSLKPEDVAEAKRHPEIRVESTQSTDYGFLVFNLQRPILSSRALRRALTMAIDRSSLATNVFDTLARVALGPTVRVFPTTDTSLAQIPFDPHHAMETLDSLGWRAGSPQGIRSRNGKKLAFTMLVATSSGAREKLATLIQQQLRKVGIDASIERIENNAMTSRLSSRDFDAAFWLWKLGATPNSLPELWGSKSARAKDGNNFASYENPRADAYTDSAIAARTIPWSRHYFTQAYQIIIDDAPAIWLYEPKTVIGLHRRIRTGLMRADSWWFDLGSWSIPRTEQIARDRVPGDH